MPLKTIDWRINPEIGFQKNKESLAVNKVILFNQSGRAIQSLVY